MNKKIEETIVSILILSKYLAEVPMSEKDATYMKDELKDLVTSVVEEALQEFVNDNKTADDYFMDGVAKGKEEEQDFQWLQRAYEFGFRDGVEEQKEKDAEIVKSYFKKDNALVRAMCIEIREQKWVKRPYEKNISAKAILESG